MSGHCAAIGGNDVDGLHADGSAARAGVHTFHADHDELWTWGLPLLARQQRCGSGSGNSAAIPRWLVALVRMDGIDARPVRRRACTHQVALAPPVDYLHLSPEHVDGFGAAGPRTPASTLRCLMSGFALRARRRSVILRSAFSVSGHALLLKGRADLRRIDQCPAVPTSLLMSVADGVHRIASARGMAGANGYPCPIVQPSSTRTLRVSSSSMPSATRSIPSSRVRPPTARIGQRLLLLVMPCRNVRSSLTMSMIGCFQMAERGVVCPLVVDRDAQTQLAQLAQAAPHLVSYGCVSVSSMASCTVGRVRASGATRLPVRPQSRLRAGGPRPCRRRRGHRQEPAAHVRSLPRSSRLHQPREIGVSRQAVHRWVGWYGDEGLTGLADRSSRPRSSPTQTAPETEAAICELRRNHPRWGARRIEFELGRNGCPGPVPSRITVHRVLIRHGLLVPASRAVPGLLRRCF